MSAHALVELEVRPADGCTIHHETVETWWAYRNDDTSDRIMLTVEDMAWALGNPVQAMSGARAYGRLWRITAMVGLRLVVVDG